MAALDLVSGNERNVFDDLLRTSGDFGLATRQRGIGQRQVASDCGTITIMLGKGSGARFGGAAAEIFAVVGHARFLLLLFRPHAGHVLSIAPP
jgi:hypothetical protein